MIPEHFTQYPYFIFYSEGSHSHPPPPPSKHPREIMAAITNILEERHDPAMTTVRFLMSPELQALCRRYNAGSLHEIHESFANLDAISALIRKHKLLHFPEGHDLNGVIFERERNPRLQEYIQVINNQTIICITQAAAELMHSIDSFEVDMSFKRIKRRNAREIVVAKFIPEHRKIYTLARIYVESETREIYFDAFTQLFDTVQRLTGRPIRFYPIHGGGIQAVVMDMCSKQYGGLCDYLQLISQVLVIVGKILR